MFHLHWWEQIVFSSTCKRQKEGKLLIISGQKKIVQDSRASVKRHSDDFCLRRKNRSEISHCYGAAGQCHSFLKWAVEGGPTSQNFAGKRRDFWIFAEISHNPRRLNINVDNSRHHYNWCWWSHHEDHKSMFNNNKSNWPL